jgi:hypothetical protein
MTDLVFNNDGIPLIGYGSRFFMSSTGGPLKYQSTKVDPDDENVDTVDGHKIYSWGSDNNFPNTADEIIRKSTVLNSGLKYKLQMIMGQGIFPTRVSGYKDDGQEILQVITDQEIQKICRSRMVRNYLVKSVRDVLKFGPAFPEFIFDEKGKKIVGINVINARHCRYEEMKNGVIENVIVFGRWPDAPSQKTEYSIVPVLDAWDPFADLERRRFAGTLAGKNVIYPMGEIFSNNDYYPFPDWYTAKEAGWIDISQKVPSFLKKIYENQISWKWHVKIPYAYWDKKYPKTEYKDVKQRMQLIQDDMDLFEETLTGEENAHKAIFTHFEVNSQGKPEEQWVIEPLDNKYKSEYQLIESAVADSNILFSINVNPTIMGAGLPGSGPYAGKTGGSDIRESFLVNVALAWLERQNALDPLECMLEFNGIHDVELRFRNTVLTTLDAGKGTQKVVS